MKANLKGAFDVLFAASLSLPVSAAEHTKESLDTIEKNLTAQRAVLIDVRENNETNQGYIDGAILVPLSLLNEGHESEGFAEVLAQRLPRKAIIYVYCATGKRCLPATDLLAGLGFSARALPYGYEDLAREGFVTAKPK